MNQDKSYLSSLISGGIAGMTVDILLYPIDTIKTRLQSTSILITKNLYKGINTNLLGSFPSAALFFITYDTMKRTLSTTSLGRLRDKPHFVHMIAAICGEIGSCTIRVPHEVLKQRLQTHQYNTLRQSLTQCYRDHGMKGFYKGYGTTLIREIPFSVIQFPLYEYLKSKARKNGYDEFYQLSLCGSISAAFAATVTTPLDVIKTRTMLDPSTVGYFKVMKGIWVRDGLDGFFKGLVPRVLWISIGGSIFLGSYELVINKLN